MAKALYIIEGPAGSGKSSLINELIAQKRGFIRPVPFGTIARPRAYDFPDLGAGLSMAKDFLHLAEAITAPGHVLMDRGFLSQVIYGAFRSPDNGYLQTHAHELPMRIREIVDVVSSDYTFRSNQSQISTTPIFLGILLPPWKELIDRREGHLRHHNLPANHYPFDALTEHQLYQLAAQMMVKGCHIWGIRFAIIQGANDVPRL